MRLTAVHYEDIYPKAFKEFRKKYLPFLRMKGSHNYFVQFTNFATDVLAKNPHEEPDHADPVGVYGYPLQYVLKHPADVWYGSQAKYVRVLKGKPHNKALHIHYVDMNDGPAILYKMGLSRDSMDKAKKLWPDRIGKNRTSIPRMFFTAIQMDLEDVEVPSRMTNEQRRELASSIRVRTGKEQTALLRKAGFDEIEDAGSTNKQAVINDREPEQVIFLHRHAFDVIELIPLRLSTKQEHVGTAQNMGPLAPKLAALVATEIGDKITEWDGFKRTFWTKKGREINISFDRPSSYYEGKKLGEKRHKEAKLSNSFYVTVTLTSERGQVRYVSGSETFEQIAEDVAYRFHQATPVDGFTPITKKLRAEQAEAASSLRITEEQEQKLSLLKKHLPSTLEDAKVVADALHVSFTEGDIAYWQSSDELVDAFDGIMMVAGRQLSNAYHKANNQMASGERSWVPYFNKQEAVESMSKSAVFVGEDAEPARVEAVIGLYKAALDWMIKEKNWAFQSPAGFFTFLRREITGDY